ncbi:MAG TPA: dipeptide epimerase, partial [Thermoanaerobaculia bacterium]
MRILAASAELEEFPLTRPYAIAQQEPTTGVENVIVRVEALSGPNGWGAASPAENVTGETVAACREALSADRLAWLAG